jgi:predicted esterase
MERSTVTALIREAASSPAGAIVLTHGRGADADDLQPLVDLLDPEGRLLGVFPRGPLVLPPGGRHWYIVREVGFPDADTFLPTFDELAGHLDSLLAEREIPWARTVLAGFSQGAVMSYALGLGAGRPRPAAILAFSGFIPTVEGFDLALDEPRWIPSSASSSAVLPASSSPRPDSTCATARIPSSTRSRRALLRRRARSWNRSSRRGLLGVPQRTILT